MAEQFNYIIPGMEGQRQTDFVITQYRRPEYKQCSLDLVNAVANLAFIDPDQAKEMEFSIEYLYSKKRIAENGGGYGGMGHLDSLVTEMESESESSDEESIMTSQSPTSSKSPSSANGGYSINV